jgi:hypothetical protein
LKLGKRITRITNRRLLMTTLSNSFARTTFCALVAVAAAGLSFATAITAVKAADWTTVVNSRIDHAMATNSVIPGHNGIVHVKLDVAPDGAVLGATVVGHATPDQRRAALAVTRTLGALPATGFAKPVRISMMLQFADTVAEVQKFKTAPVQFASTAR